MVEYAREILDNFVRCQTRQTEIEKGIVDFVQMRSKVWDINDDTGLTAFIAEQDLESDLYSTKVEKIRSDNLTIFAKCKVILAPAPIQTSRLIPPTNPHITTGFKPNQDLKPLYLIKDCTLTELNKFIDSFTNYIKSSSTVILTEALWGQVSVNMDLYWFTEIQDQGFSRDSNLEAFLKQIEMVALIKCTVHQRRMNIFEAKPSGDSLTFLRELNEHV